MHRAADVKVQAQDAHGKHYEVEGEELLARAIQHEIDHLDGILFIFRLSRLKRDLQLRKIRKMIKVGRVVERAMRLGRLRAVPTHAPRLCGAPQFAFHPDCSLQAGHRVELVLSQPDRASGRGLVQNLRRSSRPRWNTTGPSRSQKKFATILLCRQRLTDIVADAIVVVAYGRLIPPWMLALPHHGNLNLHASLLPVSRSGAHPMGNCAMGKQETGVTTMRIDEGLDTGDMLLQRSVPIGPQQTAVELAPVLAEVGAALMVRDAGRAGARNPDGHTAAGCSWLRWLLFCSARMGILTLRGVR